MRILILNWRCPKHPQAGGAEVLTARIAERLARRGCEVTWFTAQFSGGMPTEWFNGFQIVRRGDQRTVHWQAWRWYRQHPPGYFDVVVDEINTIPFFAPLYAGVPAIAFVMQLAQEIWWYEAPPYLAPIGQLLEPLYLQVYRRTPVLTISASTKVSLRKIGLGGPVSVIPMASDFQVEEALPDMADKEQQLTLLFVGRVVPSKRIDHMVSALALLHKHGVNAQLWIAGNGDAHYKAKLESTIRKYRLTDSVKFLGQVSESMKRNLYKRAHLLLACSVREGWGLTVTEASTVGTPAVVYDVPGLRDSTVHDLTGLVCTANTPMALAQSVVALWGQPDHYQYLRLNAFERARMLNWDATADVFWKHLLEIG